MKTRTPLWKRLPFHPPVSRLREIWPSGILRGTLSALVRKISGAGEAAGKDAPSRRQSFVGLVLYSLLIPFGIQALWAHYWVTGPLLLGIGFAGVAGIAVRNLGPRSGASKNALGKRSSR